jgi:hypothetical protein
MIFGLTSKVRLRKLDPNNWVLERYTGGAIPWVGFGGYYGTVDAALHALLYRHLDHLLGTEVASVRDLEDRLEETLVSLTHLLMQIEALQTPSDPLGL